MQFYLETDMTSNFVQRMQLNAKIRYVADKRSAFFLELPFGGQDFFMKSLTHAETHKFISSEIERKTFERGEKELIDF